MANKGIPPTAVGEDDETTEGFYKGTATIEIPAVFNFDGKEVSGSVTIAQPATMAASEYPDNRAWKTPAGHLLEVDDTRGGKRIHIFHAAGTFIEVGDVGQVNMRMASSHVQVDGSHKLSTGPRVDVTSGSKRIHTDGYEVNTGGELFEDRDGNVSRTVRGDLIEEIHGTHDSQIHGDKTVRAVGALALVGISAGLAGRDVKVLASGGDAEVFAAKNASVRSLDVDGLSNVFLGYPAASDALKQHLLTEESLRLLLGTLDTVYSLLLGLGTSMTAAAAAFSALPVPVTFLNPVAVALETQLVGVATHMELLRAAVETGVYTQGGAPKNVRTFMTKAD